MNIAEDQEMIKTTGYTKIQLLQYKEEVEKELNEILSWWSTYMIDEQQGGFYGSVNNDNIPDKDAAKGVVLNSRILWTFSAAYHFTGEEKYLAIAKRSFDYIVEHFIDYEYGGAYWSVDATGKMLDGKKQIYGLAFCIYGMSEYYKVTKEEKALELAKELYNLTEQYSFDKEKAGYVEAFTRVWMDADDLRLSDKDDNEKKTMNTHLHIIEAYANLYTAWPDEQLKQKIISLLELFDKFIINKDNGHLNLFMDENWLSKSELISFGHDIEAAWLLLECAWIVGSKSYINLYREKSVELTTAVLEGWDSNGGLWYEYEPATAHWVKQKHSWPQAEAMVGFLNAWQLTGEEKYLQYSLNSFEFIKRKIKDTENGEWYWGIEEDGALMPKEKAGFWKCPYHSSRACIEVSKRISTLLK